MLAGRAVANVAPEVGMLVATLEICFVHVSFGSGGGGGKRGGERKEEEWRRRQSVASNFGATNWRTTEAYWHCGAVSLIAPILKMG